MPVGGPNIAISGLVGYRKLDDGTIERLLNKYEKYPGSFLRGANPCMVTP